MAKYQVNKTYQEINEKIRKGQAIVVTADEIIDLVREKGEVEAARTVDVVTTGTFSPMCSSGAFINFGQSQPPIRASKVWFNGVPAYGGLAAVDVFLGATEPALDDPLNKVYPGEFKYGGGHVIEELVDGKSVHLVAEGYGTDCYPNKRVERELTLARTVNAVLCNPRNAYQNYNCAINLSNHIIYTYMGPLRPRAGNANYCTAGQLSPLLNDPFYRTIGIGTRIFLGGGVGYVCWPGTQHNPAVPRGENGVPLRPAGTLMVIGDLKQMNSRYLVGVSILGYGCSLAVGLGVPIPLLNEEIAHYCAVSDEEIFAPVIDYSEDYPQGTGRILGQVSYAQLKSGIVTVAGQEVQTVPLSSLVRAREIALTLKEWIMTGRFQLGEPVELLPSS
ncbi:MAG: homocysteine biosynthesis protein [Deltaproteobacteria bacterium]|nr:homocysteine biosynthesis protein [Deltaproteobacteria bacterium]MBW1951731.1 homocysteine biosynthesis protein [Deltaproteobacteria bacterium]MBW1987247.1 homocysteine biosynthesis protein [Deltaproteobacteria bacterium]MBW2134744.1 homocysteine biosynthesis protein [Deltaproteobacteria bacterium]